jgi:hypothetical protein
MKRYLGMLFLLTVAASVVLAANSSPMGEFSATAASSTVNWLNTSGMGSHAVNVTITDLNTTRNITVLVQNYTSSVVNSTFGKAYFIARPDNSTFLQNTSSANLTLYFQTAGLSPGRYYGPVLFLNETNPLENANVTVTLDVPITLTGGIGTFAGNISNSTETYYFNASTFGNAAGLKVNLTGLGSPVTITLKDGSGATKPPQNTPGDLTYIFATNATNWQAPNEYWSIEVTNSTGNTTFGGTIEMRNASFIANNSVNTSTAYFVENVGRAQIYKSTTITIANYNNSDVTIFNVLNSSVLYRTSGAYWMNFSTNLTALSYPYTLPAMSSLTFNVNVSVDSNTTQNQSGVYGGWLYINTTNGYPWQASNITITINYTTALNVNVVSVLNPSDKSVYVVPGGNGNATLTVTYQDGTDAGLVNTSNTMSMSGWMNFTGDSTAPTSVVQGFTYVNFSKQDNNYFVNYTPPIGTPGGNYTMAFIATKGGNSGTGKFNYSYVNGSGMIVNMRATAAAQSINDYNGTTNFISATLSNIGWNNATNVTISLDTGTCASIISGGLTTSTTYYAGSMARGTTNSLISDIWKIQLAPTATSCTLNMKGESPSGAWAANDTLAVTVNLPSTTTPTDTTVNPNNPIIAPATNTTKTNDFDLSITSWPKSVSIIQGESASVDIKVKNAGKKTVQNIQTKVEGTGVDASWWKGTLLTSLTAGLEFTLPVAFTIPANASVGDYEIVYVASSQNVTARASSHLIITPNAATKVVINNTIANLTGQYDGLFNLLTEAARKGGNTSSANETLGEAKALIDKASNYAKAGDWVSANALLTQIQSALNSAETKISALSNSSGLSIINLGGQSTYLMAGGAIVVIAIGAVVVWMSKTGKPLPGIKSLPGFKPPYGKAPSPKPAYVSKDRPSILSKIKEKLKSLSIRRKGSAQYSYHYEPEK